MRVSLNNQVINLPSSLSEVTLKQRIDFQTAHGNELELMRTSILSMKDEDDKELELVNFRLESMYRSLSFFTGIDVEVLKEYEDINTIVSLYSNSLQLLVEEEKEIEKYPEYEFVWQGDEWQIYSPELKNGHKMTFGEFIDSKQIIQDMLKLGKNRWECLLPLSAVYLRKKSEVYQEGFLYDDSERLKLMEQLPLNIALHIGFFLSSSLNMLTTIFPSFSPQESKEPVNS